MLKLLGFFLVALPFLGLFALVVKEVGWWGALLAFGLIFIGTGCIMLGVYLIVRSKD